MPPGLPSRDLCRMNEGKTHRTKPQGCYRRHTDATDIPTFLRVGGERDRKLKLVHVRVSTGLSPLLHAVIVQMNAKKDQKNPTKVATFASLLQESDWKEFSIILPF